ncbi:ulp1 protease family, C-terminal catalytic domain-containing protein [Tanacetum coccineum]
MSSKSARQRLIGMATLKRKGGDDTPVRRSGRLVYQKDSDVVDVMGDSSKTKACVGRSRKLVYQEDPDDDDFVDESLKQKDFGSKNGGKKNVKVKEKMGKGKGKMVNKVGDNLEEMDRVLLRIPPISLFRIMTNLTEEQRKSVREMGFGGILEYRLSEIPTRLGYWVLDKFDEDSCSLIFSGNTIPVTREAVHEVLGIPMGIIHVDALKGTSRSNKLTKSWKSLFGGNIGRIYHSNVEDIIQSQQEGGWMFKITFLVLLFTAMGQSNKCSTVNLKFLPCILGEEDIIHLDWCTYMIECLVNTKRLWNRSTHYNGPLVMLLILYANSTKSITQNVKRITPAIAFWTASFLNKREMEEISSGGFGIHEQGEKRGNEDGEKQEVVVAEIPSTQICVKLEIDEACVEDDGYNPYATQTLIDELSTPHLLDGDEGLYPVLEDGMFSKYGTESPPRYLKLKMADIYLHEADICLKDAIKENPDDVDLKVLLKVRNEMCHELESNKCTIPKDNIDRSKEAANANGNPEGDMLSFRQMYGTPTEIIRLTTKGKVLAGPKYDEEIDEHHKIINDLQNFDSQHTTTSESSEFKTPMSNLASVSGTKSNSSSILSIKKREPKPLNAIIPNIVGAIGICLPEVLESPYTRKECSVDDGITYSEKWVVDCIFTGRFTPTLYPGIRIASGAIDVFTHVLNYAEKFHDRKSLRRVFCNTSMVSEKQFMVKDWYAKYKIKFGSLRHEQCVEGDVVFLPIIKGEHFYVICMNLKITEIHILDNINSDEQDLVKSYGTMPRVLTKLFEDYLSFEKHHREGEMKFPEYKILRMGTEGKAQNFLLNDLRYKYVSKMLLCEINMKKEEVEIETEAYKSLSIREKRRLSADASATLMERMEKMF